MPSDIGDVCVQLYEIQTRLIELRNEQPTLRDRFAMAAPPYVCSGGERTPHELDAAWRYGWADAMLAAREEGEGRG